MTVEQIIRFTRAFFPKWRDDLAKRYLNTFGLAPKRSIPDLSKGMRSKLMLLLAIARGADLLILDEPTDGLDPAATEDVLRELVAIAASEGTTMFFSSHQLAEVELIADWIGIIDRGKDACCWLAGRYEGPVPAPPGRLRRGSASARELGGRRRARESGRKGCIDPRQPQYCSDSGTGAVFAGNVGGEVPGHPQRDLSGTREE
jgi:energy-coupling factor transporter ATP-binding protein EcfA2